MHKEETVRKSKGSRTFFDSKMDQSLRQKKLFTVTLQVMEHSPAVPSPGNYFEEHGSFFQMGSKEKQSSTSTKDGNIINCKRDKFVPIVVLGDCVDTRPRSDAAPVSGDRPPTAPEDRELDPLGWLPQYTEGLNDGEWRSFVSAGETIPETSPSHILAKPSNKSEGTQNLFTQFPKDLRWWYVQTHEIHESSVQKES